MAISKGGYGGDIIYTDVGSDLKLKEQNFTRAEHTANKTNCVLCISNSKLIRLNYEDVGTQQYSFRVLHKICVAAERSVLALRA
jgi:hypothetical protein